jgi:hypothetical protein
MNCNVYRFALGRTLNQTLKAPWIVFFNIFVMLCTLDYEKYKPITEHTPHNDLIFYKSVLNKTLYKSIIIPCIGIFPKLCALECDNPNPSPNPFLDDSNLLPKFKKHSQFKRYGIF